MQEEERYVQCAFRWLGCNVEKVEAFFYLCNLYCVHLLNERLLAVCLKDFFFLYGLLHFKKKWRPVTSLIVSLMK